MKEDCQKALKKLTLYFLSNPVPFNRQNYQKQKGSGTNELQNKFKSISLFDTYYPTKFDDVMKSSFWVISKITSANLCKPIHDIISYSTFICPFESEKCERKEKITKIWITEERKELFRWNKKHFS